jgi:DNA-binding NarL/FixJ family response regulator
MLLGLSPPAVGVLGSIPRMMLEQESHAAVGHLMLTTFGEDEVLWGAIETGAAGFVLQDSSAEDLIAAVRAVAEGGAWFDPGVAPRLLHRYRRVVAPASRDSARLDLLTEREHEVLRLMARGATESPLHRTWRR